MATAWAVALTPLAATAEPCAARWARTTRAESAGRPAHRRARAASSCPCLGSALPPSTGNIAPRPFSFPTNQSPGFRKRCERSLDALPSSGMAARASRGRPTTRGAIGGAGQQGERRLAEGWRGGSGRGKREGGREKVRRGKRRGAKTRCCLQVSLPRAPSAHTSTAGNAQHR